MLGFTHPRRRQALLPAADLPTVRQDSDPLVVWRTWIVRPEERRGKPTVPMLTGLLGFPWRTGEMDAKCIVQDPDHGRTGYSRTTMDRHHYRVPDPDCTCGLYATRAALEGPPTALVPRGLPVVTGFVELSGHILEGRSNFRAQHARIIGPVHLSAGRIPLADAAMRGMGVARSPQRVVVDRGEYRIGWKPGRGRDHATWRRETRGLLADRYLVDVR